MGDRWQLKKAKARLSELVRGRTLSVARVRAKYKGGQETLTTPSLRATPPDQGGEKEEPRFSQVRA